MARWMLLSVAAMLAQPGFAGPYEFLPNAHELFQPLKADPRELQYRLQFAVPVSHKLFGEAAMGDYLGLVRGDLPNGARWQLNAGGGAFARFDMAGANNDMQVVDFYGNVPMDVDKGDWSGRFMFFHTSSHLGDDYLKTHGGTTDKHAWDNLRWLTSYKGINHLRLYGGYTYVFRTLPTDLGRNALQSGVEWTSPQRGYFETYWANDVQFWERTGWDPMFTSQAGITAYQTPANRPAGRPGGRAVSLFLEFGTGHQPQGQFFAQRETHWNFGLKFHLT